MLPAQLRQPARASSRRARQDDRLPLLRRPPAGLPTRRSPAPSWAGTGHPASRCITGSKRRRRSRSGSVGSAEVTPQGSPVRHATSSTSCPEGRQPVRRDGCDRRPAGCMSGRLRGARHPDAWHRVVCTVRRLAFPGLSRPLSRRSTCPTDRRRSAGAVIEAPGQSAAQDVAPRVPRSGSRGARSLLHDCGYPALPCPDRPRGCAIDAHAYDAVASELLGGRHRADVPGLGARAHRCRLRGSLRPRATSPPSGYGGAGAYFLPTTSTPTVDGAFFVVVTGPRPSPHRRSPSRGRSTARRARRRRSSPDE